MIKDELFFKEVMKARENAMKIVDFSNPKRFENVVSLDAELPFKPNQVLYNMNYEFRGSRNEDYLHSNHYEYGIDYVHSTKGRAHLRHEYNKENCKVKYCYEKINFNLGKLMAKEYKWCLMFESEEVAKEYCRVKNEAQKYFLAKNLGDAEEPGGMPDKRRHWYATHWKDLYGGATAGLIGKTLFYCEGNQIKSVIPRTSLAVEKLYADKKGKLFDNKTLLIHEILNFGWQDSAFQYLPKEKVKEIIENNDEDECVNFQRLKEKVEREKCAEMRPISIPYCRFFYGIEEEKASYHFSEECLKEIQVDCPVKLFIQICGNENTTDYPDDLKGFPGVFVEVPYQNGEKTILQYIKTIPGLDKKYEFRESRYYDVTEFYNFLLNELNTLNKKKKENESNKNNENVEDRQPVLKNMLHLILKNTVENQENFKTLIMPAHIHECFNGITEKETEVLLNNPQSKKLLAEREYIRKMLGVPDYD